MYTVVTDHKPIQKEALQLMADELEKIQERHRPKKNVLSPTTIREYDSAMHTIPDRSMDENVHDMTAINMRLEINRLAQ